MPMDLLTATDGWLEMSQTVLPHLYQFGKISYVPTQNSGTRQSFVAMIGWENWKLISFRLGVRAHRSRLEIQRQVDNKGQTKYDLQPGG